MADNANNSVNTTGRRVAPRAAPPQRAHKLARTRPDKRLTLPYLHGVADQLMKDADLSVDQQHQLLTVVRYLELEPDTSSTHGRAALRCAELLIDNVRLAVYQRRYGMERD